MPKNRYSAQAMEKRRKTRTFGLGTIRTTFVEDDTEDSPPRFLQQEGDKLTEAGKLLLKNNRGRRYNQDWDEEQVDVPRNDVYAKTAQNAQNAVAASGRNSNAVSLLPPWSVDAQAPPPSRSNVSSQKPGSSPSAFAAAVPRSHTVSFSSPRQVDPRVPLASAPHRFRPNLGGRAPDVTSRKLDPHNVGSNASLLALSHNRHRNLERPASAVPGNLARYMRDLSL